MNCSIYKIQLKKHGKKYNSLKTKFCMLIFVTVLIHLFQLCYFPFTLTRKTIFMLYNVWIYTVISNLIIESRQTWCYKQVQYLACLYMTHLCDIHDLDGRQLTSLSVSTLQQTHDKSLSWLCHIKLFIDMYNIL